MELVKKPDTFKMIIPDEVEKKIRYLCQNIWNDEWSGTLFYRPEGKFEDGSLTITCVDLFVMDVGTATYTEFDMSPDVISYMARNPELLDCQIGLIHSHNNMSTFFSGTDLTTLRDEGMDRNHFVSLIVNNKGSYTAAITRRLKYKQTIEEKFSYPTFGDTEVNDNKSYETKNEELQWFSLEIEKGENSFKDELDSRLNEIKESKKTKVSNIPFKEVQIGKVAGQSFIPSVQDEEIEFDDYGKENKETTLFYKTAKFNEQTIKSLVLQLVTGSIIIPNSSKIDINKWANNMVPLYENRFGKGEYGIKLFKTWAEGYIEFLCWFSEDNKLIEQGIEDEEMTAICAKGMIKELKKLPKNKYIKIYIDTLEGYLI